MFAKHNTFPADVLKRHQLVKSISMKQSLIYGGEEQAWDKEDKARKFREEKALEIKNHHTLNVVFSMMVLSKSFQEAHITFGELSFLIPYELFPTYAEPTPCSFIRRSVGEWASGPRRKTPHSASQGGKDRLGCIQYREKSLNTFVAGLRALEARLYVIDFLFQIFSIYIDSASDRSIAIR